MDNPFDHHVPPPHATVTAADYGVSDDDEDEEEEEEVEEEEEEEEEEEDDNEEDEDSSPRAFPVAPSTTSNPQPIVITVESQSHSSFGDDEVSNKRRKTEGREASSSSLAIDGSQGSEWNCTDIDGLFCPICMEAWTNSGDHQICCLPCGHIYGMSCIKRWLQQRRSTGKCPQCNIKCSLKDVRKLYASRVVTVDDESQKKIRLLEAKCAALESKGADWRVKEAIWRKREAAYRLEIQKLKALLLDMERMHFELIDGTQDYQWRSEKEQNFSLKSHVKASFCNFALQKTFNMDDARVFDMDVSNQILLIARKPRVIGGADFLTKMSLIPPFDMEDILLPSTTEGIRDLHISPSDRSLALYASTGKKLSVLSVQSKNTVVNYDLQVPPWSCSWDLNSSHYMYTGLQNGSVLVFDIRQTAGPMKSLVGLTSNPVHTVHSLLQTSCLPNSILSASAIGLCQWNIDSEEGPFMLPETDNQGVCISLAYCPSSDDVVVSYRPKFDMSMGMQLSQLSSTPSQVIGAGMQGCHVLFKRQRTDYFKKMGSSNANPSKIRFPKHAIIDIEGQRSLFAAVDEATFELILHELPSFSVNQRFKLPAQARDIRYSRSCGILGCLSETTLQLFYTKVL